MNAEATARSGRCLCGAIRFTAVPAHETMDACHCHMCRRWAAGPFMGVECKSLTFTCDEAPSVYQSSDWGERGFCGKCGTPLFWRMRDGSMMTVAAHAFDEPTQYPLTVEIFIDEKPDGYAFAGDAKKMTGAEVAALFGAQQP